MRTAGLPTMLLAVLALLLRCPSPVAGEVSYPFAAERPIVNNFGELNVGYYEHDHNEFFPYLHDGVDFCADGGTDVLVPGTPRVQLLDVLSPQNSPSGDGYVFLRYVDTGGVYHVAYGHIEFAPGFSPGYVGQHIEVQASDPVGSVLARDQHYSFGSHLHLGMLLTHDFESELEGPWMGYDLAVDPLDVLEGTVDSDAYRPVIDSVVVHFDESTGYVEFIFLAFDQVSGVAGSGLNLECKEHLLYTTYPAGSTEWLRDETHRYGSLADAESDAECDFVLAEPLGPAQADVVQGVDYEIDSYKTKHVLRWYEPCVTSVEDFDYRIVVRDAAQNEREKAHNAGGSSTILIESLECFDAEAGPTLEWVVSEHSHGIRGFCVWRSSGNSGGYAGISGIIPIREPLLVGGTCYSYTDTTAPFGTLQYKLECMREDGGSGFVGPVEHCHENASPVTVALEPPSPNPASDGSTIHFNGHPGSWAEVSIYDVGGRLVRRLHSGVLEERSSAVLWDCRNADGDRVVSGVYLCLLRVAGESRTSKIVVLD